MKRTSYWIVAAAVVLLAATVIFRTFTQPASASRPQQEEQQAESGGPAASPLSGTKAVTLSPGAQGRLGIRVETLAASSARKRISAPAVVLSAQGLAGLRNAYVAAQASVDKSRVTLGVDRKESERLGTLYRDSQNVSQKQLQAAQGAVDSDTIGLRAARQQLAMQAALVRQNWGGAVMKWVEDASPELDRVLGQSDMLVEISLPPGLGISPASTVWLSQGKARSVRARLVSPFPQVDPRVQGASFLYVASAAPGLVPGVTLTAQIPVGRNMRGFVVPASAVVWSDGAAWVYVQTVPTSFMRQPLATDFPMNDGYFAAQGFSAGERVVVSGAQLLLSEELSPPPSASSGEDDDD